jgi:hypothetical protein
MNGFLYPLRDNDRIIPRAFADRPPGTIGNMRPDRAAPRYSDGFRNFVALRSLAAGMTFFPMSPRRAAFLISRWRCISIPPRSCSSRPVNRSVAIDPTSDLGELGVALVYRIRLEMNDGARTFIVRRISSSAVFRVPSA